MKIDQAKDQNFRIKGPDRWNTISINLKKKWQNAQFHRFKEIAKESFGNLEFKYIGNDNQMKSENVIYVPKIKFKHVRFNLNNLSLRSLNFTLISDKRDYLIQLSNIIII